jgi:hypothetical protein
MVSFMVWLLHHTERSSQDPSSGRLDRPQSYPGLFGEQLVSCLSGTEQLLSYTAYRLVTLLYYPTSPCYETTLLHQNALFTTVTTTFQQYDYIAVNILVDKIYS